MKNEENNVAKEIRELLHPTDYTHAMDLRGESIGDVCVCGGDVFHALVAFDQGEICFYFLDGECANCGSMVTLPHPPHEDFI
jgi:hypothetical protein